MNNLPLSQLGCFAYHSRYNFNLSSSLILHILQFKLAWTDVEQSKLVLKYKSQLFFLSTVEFKGLFLDVLVYLLTCKKEESQYLQQKSVCLKFEFCELL